MNASFKYKNYKCGRQNLQEAALERCSLKYRSLDYIKKCWIWYEQILQLKHILTIHKQNLVLKVVQK